MSKKTLFQFNENLKETRRNTVSTLKVVYEGLLKNAAKETMWKEIIIVTMLSVMKIAKKEGAGKEVTFWKYVEFLESEKLIDKKSIKMLSFTKDWDINLRRALKECQKKDEIKKHAKLCLKIVKNWFKHLDALVNLEDSIQ